jgi:hypothetical protein
MLSDYICKSVASIKLIEKIYTYIIITDFS